MIKQAAVMCHEIVNEVCMHGIRTLVHGSCTGNRKAQRACSLSSMRGLSEICSILRFAGILQSQASSVNRLLRIVCSIPPLNKDAQILITI